MEYIPVTTKQLLKMFDSIVSRGTRNICRRTSKLQPRFCSRFGNLCYLCDEATMTYVGLCFIYVHDHPPGCLATRWVPMGSFFVCVLRVWCEHLSVRPPHLWVGAPSCLQWDSERQMRLLQWISELWCPGWHSFVGLCQTSSPLWQSLSVLVFFKQLFGTTQMLIMHVHSP